MKIKFIEVGRYKSSWEAEMQPTEVAITNHLRKRKVLASKLIDVDMETGEIVAGFRCVGRFERQEPKNLPIH